ncbi:hypothetical protein BDW59DRAFT_150064 [Aspergillus cavernicola]|uniref:Indoleamine 2,3-dioxygenase n=1 Tax=Aspergillus cavernicola TaxID=176166 RepID=A0ABR4I0X6_9EURO
MLSFLSTLVRSTSLYFLSPLQFLWLHIHVPKVFTRITPASAPAHQYHHQSSEAPSYDKQDVKHANALASIHRATENGPVLQELKHLVQTDGAGNWPPCATHGDTWPAALRPYHAIYLEAAPFLATEDVILDDRVSSQRVDSFRERLRDSLQSRVDLPSVKDILSAAENENATAELSFASYNGFSACMATLRHAFRWGVIPVVRVAQEQKIISFPAELDLPWEFICRRYGVTSHGGNVMTNYFSNFDEHDRIVYQVNGGLSDLIQTAEYNFAHIFVAVERLVYTPTNPPPFKSSKSTRNLTNSKHALPIYLEMTKAIIHYSRGNRRACLESLRTINSQFSGPPKIFYKTLVDAHISPEVWMRYVQGFPGWAAGEIIDGEYIEYDGLSGSHSLFFRVADAFLDIPAYFSEESTHRYVPVAQRRLCDAIREHGFRGKARENGDLEIEGEMERMVQQLRTFRATHRGRIHKYLSAPAPERMIMTAGKSVLESNEIPEIETAIKHLGGILVNRIKETR